MASETKITLPIISFVVGVSMVAVGWGYTSSQRLTALEVKSDMASNEINKHERLEERVRILENTLSRQTEILNSIQASVARIERGVHRAR